MLKNKPKENNKMEEAKICKLSKKKLKLIINKNNKVLINKIKEKWKRKKI